MLRAGALRLTEHILFVKIYFDGMYITKSLRVSFGVGYMVIGLKWTPKLISSTILGYLYGFREIVANRYLKFKLFEKY